MKCQCRHVSMFMMTVTLAYSAPIEYEYEMLEVVTPTKPILRQADDNPGKCCSDRSQRCCPYDYDDRCETTNNRTLCGYNKNQIITDNNEFFTKFGLPCRINDDRFECGYNGPYITDVIDPLPNSTTGNPSGCCDCCNEQTTKSEITTTEAVLFSPETATETTFESTISTEPTEIITKNTETTHETTQTSTETTEISTETTESIEFAEETTRTAAYKKLDHRSTEPIPPATKCVTVEEKCHIIYEQPCIMDPPCHNDYSD